MPFIDRLAYSEHWHRRNSLFKYFQGYACILRDIDAYSATLTSVLLGGRGEISPALLEIECPDFGKRDLDYVDLWVKFSIQNGNV